MPRARTLNTFASPQWAAVVSGVIWKVHTLAPDGGVVSVELTHAPSIVWASKGGEEEVGKLSRRVPSPLDVRAAVVNAAPHLKAFERAAHRKVRPSVRWKTGRKLRQKLFTAFRLEYIYCYGQLSEAEGNEELSKIFKYTSRYRWVAEDELSKGYKRGRGRVVYHLSYDYGLSHLDSDDAVKIIEEVVGKAARGELNITLPSHTGYNLPGTVPERKLSILEILRFCFYDLSAFQTVLQAIKTHSLPLALTLRTLKSAAYRAHLARRVKPAPRPPRIRPPLYARPRPPTAPIAPPVI